MNTYTGPRRHAEDPDRRKWQDPEAILVDIGLNPGHTFADIGCGGGFFTLPAARIVGNKGMVYGVDTDAQSINEMEQHALAEGLKNLRLTTGKAEDALLCHACADIVFFGIVLHDFDDPAKVLENARKMIKTTGKLVNLDWKKEPTPFGPPLAKRFTPEKASEMIEAAGFKVEKVANVGEYNYMIIAGT